jgi:hypothetical protein
MKITVEFEEKDIRDKIPLVDQWGTRHRIMSFCNKNYLSRLLNLGNDNYLYNLLNLGNNNLVFECAISADELVNYLSMHKFLPENQTPL